MSRCFRQQSAPQSLRPRVIARNAAVPYAAHRSCMLLHADPRRTTGSSLPRCAGGVGWRGARNRSAPLSGANGRGGTVDCWAAVGDAGGAGAGGPDCCGRLRATDGAYTTVKLPGAAPYVGRSADAARAPRRARAACGHTRRGQPQPVVGPRVGALASRRTRVGGTDYLVARDARTVPVTGGPPSRARHWPGHGRLAGAISDVLTVAPSIPV